MSLQPEIKLIYKQFSVTCLSADDTMKLNKVCRILYAVAGEADE